MYNNIFIDEYNDLISNTQLPPVVSPKKRYIYKNIKNSERAKSVNYLTPLTLAQKAMRK